MSEQYTLTVRIQIRVRETARVRMRTRADAWSNSAMMTADCALARYQHHKYAAQCQKKSRTAQVSVTVGSGGALTQKDE
jgi:hypothetical protein